MTKAHLRWNQVLTPVTTLLTLAAAGLSGMIGLSGCAAVSAAALELPPELATRAPESVAGIGGGRSGRFEVAGGLRGRFERGADRLALFDDRVTMDRVQATLEAEHADGRRTRLSCRGRQMEAAAGIVALPLKSWTVECGDTESGAALTLGGHRAGAGTRDERSGTWQRGATQFGLRSLHRWQGAAWPSSAPVGYVLHDAREPGRVLGAVELGSTPRLWRAPAATAAVHDDVVLALLAAALLWDPVAQ